MPTVNGTVVLGRQVLATLPANTSTYIRVKLLTYPSIPPQTLVGTVLLALTFSSEGDFIYEAKKVYQDGVVFDTGIPSGGGKVIAVWRSPAQGRSWRVTY